jgi:UDPglucose 6-dehydrogenase
MHDDLFFRSPLIRDLADFKYRSATLVANRYDTELADVKDKVYPRDLFGSDS